MTSPSSCSNRSPISFDASDPTFWRLFGFVTYVEISVLPEAIRFLAAVRSPPMSGTREMVTSICLR